MHARMTERHVAAAVVGFVALVLGLYSAVAGRQPVTTVSKPPARKAPPAEFKLPPGLVGVQPELVASALYYGSGSCSGCHTNPIPAYSNRKDFLQFNEYHVWLTQDKHSQAYCVLEGPVGQRMGELLGWKVTERQECLNCHATHVPEERRGDLYALSDGVSCDGCHGPAAYWLGPHQQKSWRTVPGAVKEQQFGMLDVRDPVRRTKMCASCHIGNVEEGKSVTHEMYAAGHPPLPSFEVSFFSDQLPRHWKYLSEKPAAIQAEFGFDPAELTKTRFATVGGAVGLSASLRMLAAQTTPQEGGESAWPEFAQFDCYACHHELRPRSWRQAAGYAGRPGRPAARPWPLTLARISAEVAGEGFPQQFTQHSAALTQAFQSRPFGDAAQVRQQALEFAEWMDLLLANLSDRQIDTETADRCLREIARAAEEPTDYDSARQLAWAFRIIFDERHPNRESRPAEVSEALTALAEALRLEFPKRAEPVEAADAAAPAEGQKCTAALKSGAVVAELPASLTAISEYDPAKVTAAFRTLREHLKSPDAAAQ